MSENIENQQDKNNSIKFDNLNKQTENIESKNKILKTLAKEISFEQEQDNNTEIEKFSQDEIITQNNKLNIKKVFIQSTFYLFMFVFCLSYLSFSFVFNFYLTPIKVVGISMQPTINSTEYNLGNNDKTHCDIVYYKKNKFYNNNDIVIVSNKNENYTYIADDEPIPYFIKRVIATSGQKIKFEVTQKETSIYSITYYYSVSVFDSNNNNINLDQSYLDPSEKMHFVFYSPTQLEYFKDTFPFYYELINNLYHYEFYEVEIPNNKYFVMGDNRNNSTDSRYFGFVAYDDIVGSVKLIVAYNKSLFQAIIIKIKSYF